MSRAGEMENKKSIKIIAMAFLFLSPFKSYSYYIYGMGVNDCLSWVNTENSNDENKDIAILANKSWVSGYLSGLNEGTNKENFYSKGINSTTTYDYIIFYCKKNPSKGPADAINDMLSKVSTNANTE